MGNVDTKLNFRKAVVQLTSKTDPIDANDDAFWEQFWSENVNNVQDIFTLVPAPEIRALREEAPSNLATLCYKAVEKLVKAVDNSCRTQHEQQTVLNCVRLLTRVLPYIFEDPEWRGFFWSSLPSQNEDEDESLPLAQSLLNATCDLLFCPDFTVMGTRKIGPDKAEDLSAIDSCEYIWEAGVGFAQTPPRHPQVDTNRTELLKLLLTCFSETMYQPPMDISQNPNKWIAYLTSAENRHALPMFTSLLNTVCAYDPVGLGVPYNHLIFNDSVEPLVEACLQILIVTLDHDTSTGTPTETEDVSNSNLVYTIIRKRQVFHSLANLPCDYGSITKSLNKGSKRHLSTSTSHENVPETAMEGSRPALPAEPGTLKATLPDTPAIAQMTERESAHPSYHQLEQLSTLTNGVTSISLNTPKMVPSSGDGDKVKSEPIPIEVKLPKAESQVLGKTTVATRNSLRVTNNSDPTNGQWVPTAEWVHSWKSKLPLQTIMRLLQVLVPQVEKICIDKGLTDESEILKFLQHGTLVGLLPVPHPILIRKYQANSGTTTWFRTYMWGVIYLRNVDPPVWYDTDVKLFEIQRV
ncbi:protein hid1 [Holotrichia oblita]|uniref:Protein hid1 n=1 Tax=Holotrichia oblita TaxID=644536 RepID=A0ACB9SU72_HOLOL|nr:protein hid1 [Holotrichia oblita]